MTQNYDPHAIDRLVTAILANAVEDATGNPVGIDHKIRGEHREYHRKRLAARAIDWLVEHGAEYLEHIDMDSSNLHTWISSQEAKLFGDREADLSSAVSPAPVESNAVRAGRPVTNRVGSLWGRRLDWVGRTGKVYRCTIPRHRRAVTRT